MATFASLKADGNTHFKAKRYTEAITTYGSALDTSPGSTDAAVVYNNRAFAKFKQACGDRQQLLSALSDAQAAAEADPSNVKAFYRIGQIHQAMNHPDDALQAVWHAHTLAPSDKDVTAMLHQLDPDLKALLERVKRYEEGTTKLRGHLQGMFDPRHPRSLYIPFREKWTKQWTPKDRRGCLNAAANKLFQSQEVLNELKSQSQYEVGQVMKPKQAEAHARGASDDELQAIMQETMGMSKQREEEYTDDVYKLIDLSLNTVLVEVMWQNQDRMPQFIQGPHPDPDPDPTCKL